MGSDQHTCFDAGINKANQIHNVGVGLNRRKIPSPGCFYEFNQVFERFIGDAAVVFPMDKFFRLTEIPLR